MKDMIKGIIFDLDGTLVDSMWIWRSIDIDYLGRYGFEIPEGLQSEIEGQSFEQTAIYFKERFHIDEPIEKIKDDWNQMAWDKYTNEVPLKNGVLKLLEYSAANDIKLGIASSNSRELVSQVLSVHNIQDYFNTIVTGSDIIKGKPAPDIYLTAAKNMNVLPEQCLVFEDIVPGIQAGKCAGMTVCAVEDKYSADTREKKKELSDYYIKDYFEVVKNGKWIFTD